MIHKYINHTNYETLENIYLHRYFIDQVHTGRVRPLRPRLIKIPPAKDTRKPPPIARIPIIQKQHSRFKRYVTSFKSVI